MSSPSLQEIRATLMEMLPDLSLRYSVQGLSIFGSRVRDDAKDTSDIDILVDFHQRGYSLWEFIGLEQDIEDRLGLKVDLVDRRALRPELIPFVFPEAVPV